MHEIVFQLCRASVLRGMYTPSWHSVTYNRNSNALSNITLRLIGGPQNCGSIFYDILGKQMSQSTLLAIGQHSGFMFLRLLMLGANYCVFYV